MASELCTLEQVKRHADLNLDEFDEVIADAIEEASHAVCRWAGRQFGKDTAATARTFPVGPYAAGRVIPIADLAADPTDVSVLDAEGAVVSAVPLASVALLPVDRAADEPITMLRFRPSAAGLSNGYEITVTGVWGFPSVPLSVRQATIETVRHWLRGTQAVAQEVPDVAEQGFPAARGLPLKARHLLDPYRRMVVA